MIKKCVALPLKTLLSNVGGKSAIEAMSGESLHERMLFAEETTFARVGARVNAVRQHRCSGVP